MFYKKKYQQAVAERDAWQHSCLKRSDKIRSLNHQIRQLEVVCNFLERDNAKLRRKDAFTFDKAEFQRLKLENADLKKEVEELHAKNKGAKK